LFGLNQSKGILMKLFILAIKVRKYFPSLIRRPVGKILFTARRVFFNKKRDEIGYSKEYNIKYYYDGHIAECLYYDDFEPYTREYLRKKIKSEDVVMNIGANIGLFSIFCAKNLNINGFIYAIEARKKTYEKLTKNIFINGVDNIKAYNLAASDSEGILSVVEPESGLDSEVFVRKDGLNENNDQSVFAVTIDGLMKKENLRNPQCLIIDIEGHEYQALLGAKECLAQANVLVIEITKNAKEVIEIISSAGYIEVWSKKSRDLEGQYFYEKY
jgi:FkbM family methyltransferase